MGEAESWRAEPIGEKCSGGFPRPGRIHFTMGDLADEAKQSATKPELMEDVLSLVALAADKNCTAAVSKPQLEAFRDQAKDPAIAAGAQRIINDFDKIATMSKQDWSEIKDPDARALVEKYLKDNAPDSVISPNDVAMMKTLSPFGRSFFSAFDLEPERERAAKADGPTGILWGRAFGGGHAQAYNTLLEKLKERQAVRDNFTGP